MSVRTFAYTLLKGLSRPSKKKEEYRNGQEFWLKVEKDQEQHKTTIIWIKDRAVKFHKPSITYWARAVLQPKNKQQSAAITQSVGITDQEITSVFKLLYFAFTIKQISN